MANIILDCELMKTKDSGLYYYCLNLGLAINKKLREQKDKPIKFYVPSKEVGVFHPQNTIVERPYHRFLKPFLLDCKVWHRPFQSGRIIPRRTSGIKILLTIHDLNMLHQDVPQKEKEKSVASAQELISRSDAIVCVSDFAKTDVLKYCDVGSKPIYVIYNGVNQLDVPMLNISSYKPSHPFLFSIGFINQKKNLHSLLPLLKLNADIELVIAGRLDDPDYIKGLKDQAEKDGYSNRLKILGPVSEKEKAWYLQNCLAYMHPSYAEGFGLPVVEAMHFGKPLFLSNLTSLPEIGGDVAFYFESFEPEHMQQVFRQGMQRYAVNNMSEKIQDRGKGFNWEKSAEEYIKVYHSLM
jgi:glycosyltransferase involved in cell wall biosynthesis